MPTIRKSKRSDQWFLSDLAAILRRPQLKTTPFCAPILGTLKPMTPEPCFLDEFHPDHPPCNMRQPKKNTRSHHDKGYFTTLHKGLDRRSAFGSMETVQRSCLGAMVTAKTGNQETQLTSLRFSHRTKLNWKPSFHLVV